MSVSNELLQKYKLLNVRGDVRATAKNFASIFVKMRENDKLKKHIKRNPVIEESYDEIQRMKKNASLISQHSMMILKDLLRLKRKIVVDFIKKENF